MPGINLICDFQGALAGKRASYLESLQETVISPDYKSEILLEDRTYILSCTKYEQYPIRSFENDTFQIYLEGKIYGRDVDSLKQQLYSLAQTLFSEKENAKRILARWLLETDGEFIIFMLHKPSNRIIIINDVFSRLPLYGHESDGQVILSRDFWFISSLIKDKEFDRMAIAQYLLLCYSLGRRTFLKNVHRIEPASLIRIDTQRGCIRKEIVYQFNFDTKEHRNKSVGKNAHELTSLFTEACKNRVDAGARAILSLSGGLDSRAVGAGLWRANIPFVAASWLDFRKVVQLDVNTAQQVAEALNVEWKKFELRAALGRDVLKLLRISGGLSPLGMSYHLQYLEQVKQQYGPNVVFFAGNGGDRVARDIRPWRKLKDLDDLADYVITKGRFLVPSGITIDDIAALTQIPKGEIAAELKDHFASYPEKELAQKFMHLNIYGQAFKRLHEADGRKRFFFWPTSPFWSVDFFRYIMNCPDNQKTNVRLYTKFLSMLHPQMTKVGYAPNRAAKWMRISKEEYAFWHLIRKIRKLPNPVRFGMKKIKRLAARPEESVHTFNHGPNLVRCLQEQLNNCSAISNYLSRQGLEDIINNRHKYNREALGIIFTITSVIEAFVCGKSTIENYRESDLDSYA